MKISTKIIGALVFVLFSISAFSQTDENSAWTLEDCLNYGVAKHPLLKVARSNIAGEKARLQTIDAAFDPRVDLRANWRRQKIESSRSRAITDPLIDSTSESVSISKTIFDSGQNRMQLKAVRESLSAVESRFQGALLEVATGIKSAFFKSQQALALLKVRLETLQGYERHLEKVEGFVEVGTRPPYDITRAQVDVANARVDLISAKSQVKVSLANLCRAIGKDGTISIDEYPADLLPEISGEEKSELLLEALSRPEVKSADFQQRSAVFRIEEAKRNLRPTLSASGDYSWSGTVTPLDRQWGMGLSLSWPVFDGRINRSKIDSARSQHENAAASLENLSLNVRAELENALTGLADAIERYHATRYLVQQARESMALAEGRYDAGLGSPIEIADARVEFARAQGNHVVAYFDSLINAAELDRVLGRMPAEISQLSADTSN